MPSFSSDISIRKWKPTKDGEAHSVGNRTKLYVRGWRSGSKVFYFRTDTWLKIGGYPDTTLATAREFAITAGRLNKEGFSNPALRMGFSLSSGPAEFEEIVRRGLPNRDTIYASETYNDLFKDWYSEIAPGLQEGPSRRRPKAIHELHIQPTLGDRPIRSIRRREVFELLTPLFLNIPVTAGHALGHLNKIFERAINLEIIENNPVPPRSAFPSVRKRKKPHGTIPPEKLPKLWQWLQTTGASLSCKAAILCAMCTAHRVGVIVNAEWKHIDPVSGLWEVPERVNKSTKGRMKSGNSYSLQLPKGLMEIFLSLRNSSDQRFVFESPVKEGPITSNAVLKELKYFNSGLTTHGFRNAIKAWCRTTVPPVPDHIADAFCDHSLRGLDSSYRRIDTSKERAALAERLFKYIISNPRSIRI